MTEILQCAFNLTANESQHYLEPGQTGGYPSIWLDSSRSRLCVEFVRRKASMNPGITYQVEFSANFSDWTANATLLSTTAIDSIWERVRYEDTTTLNQAAVRFCRVAVRQ